MRTRKRFQNPQPYKKNLNGRDYWVIDFRDALAVKRQRSLGACATTTESQAKMKAAEIIRPINDVVMSGHTVAAARIPERFGSYIDSAFLPTKRNKWKGSTAGTSEQLVKSHIMPAFEDRRIPEISRTELQSFLDQKAAAGLSKSVVSHLKGLLGGVFTMAMSDRLIQTNPAAALQLPRCKPPARPMELEPGVLRQALSELPLRERLWVACAVVLGMRPGEFLALRVGEVGSNSIRVSQRVYRGVIDTPKTAKSVREIALGPKMAAMLREWIDGHLIDRSESAWLFPSEANTPMSRDNVLNRHLKPLLAKLGLDGVNFRALRRGQASIGNDSGVDPKVGADVRGHDIGVSMNLYTVSGFGKKLEAIVTLEEVLL